MAWVAGVGVLFNEDPYGYGRPNGKTKRLEATNLFWDYIYLVGKKTTTELSSHFYFRVPLAKWEIISLGMY